MATKIIGIYDRYEELTVGDVIGRNFDYSRAAFWGTCGFLAEITLYLVSYNCVTRANDFGATYSGGSTLRVYEWVDVDIIPHNRDRE